MRINFYITIALFFSFVQTQAQVALPYSTGFDNAGEQSGWEEYRLSAGTQFYFWNYSTANPHSAPNCLAHNYPVGGSSVTDDWFVSPMFNLEDGGMIDGIWHSFSGFGTPQTEDTLAIYLLIGSQNPALASERIMLHDFKTGYQNDNTWRNTTDIEIPEAAAHSYIAFRYKTVVNWLDVKLDDIQISGNSTVAIAPKPSLLKDVECFPNPAKDFVLVSNPSGTPRQMTVFNLYGQKISTHTLAVSSAPQRIDISSLQSGIYFMHTNFDGKEVMKKIIKE